MAPVTESSAMFSPVMSFPAATAVPPVSANTATPATPIRRLWARAE